jgi:hypothetical protein
MRVHVLLRPALERAAVGERLHVLRVHVGKRLVGGPRKCADTRASSSSVMTEGESRSAAHSSSTWRANSSGPSDFTRILMRAFQMLSRRP